MKPHSIIIVFEGRDIDHVELFYEEGDKVVLRMGQLRDDKIPFTVMSSEQYIRDGDELNYQLGLFK